MSFPVAPDAQQPVPPVCPRHPDRVTYVSCQRCRRPVCPECGREASVGIQCVDCVREQNRSMRGARTVFGGSYRPGPPVVTIVLIAICVLVWVAELTVSAVFDNVALVPAYAGVEPWRYVTSAFAHSPSQFWHIVFNMYALWILGTYLEPMLGRARFIALYLLSALGGGVAFVLTSFPPAGAGSDGVHWYTYVVGASGAVFGLFGALLILNRRLGRSSAPMYGVLAINFVLGFLVPGIAWQAHLGGFAIGALAALVLAHLGRSRPGDAEPGARRHVQWFYLGGLLVVLVAAHLVKMALS